MGTAAAQEVPPQSRVSGQPLDDEVAPGRMHPGDPHAATRRKWSASRSTSSRGGRESEPSWWRRSAATSSRSGTGPVACRAGRSADRGAHRPAHRTRCHRLGGGGQLSPRRPRHVEVAARCSLTTSRRIRSGVNVWVATIWDRTGAATAAVLPAGPPPWRDGRGSATFSSASRSLGVDQHRVPVPGTARPRAPGGAGAARRAAAPAARSRSASGDRRAPPAAAPCARAQRSAASGRYSVEPNASSAMNTWRRAAGRTRASSSSGRGALVRLPAVGHLGQRDHARDRGLAHLGRPGEHREAMLGERPHAPARRRGWGRTPRASSLCFADGRAWSARRHVAVMSGSRSPQTQQRRHRQAQLGPGVDPRAQRRGVDDIDRQALDLGRGLV